MRMLRPRRLLSWGLLGVRLLERAQTCLRLLSSLWGGFLTSPVFALRWFPAPFSFWVYFLLSIVSRDTPARWFPAEATFEL